MPERSKLLFLLGTSLMITGGILLLGHIRLHLMPICLAYAGIGAWVHLRGKKYLAATALFILFIGAGMNTAVIAANGWRMPAFTTDQKKIDREIHTLAGEKTKFKPLCDRDALQGFSPGDLTGITGILLFYYGAFFKRSAKQASARDLETKLEQAETTSSMS